MKPIKPEGSEARAQGDERVKRERFCPKAGSSSVKVRYFCLSVASGFSPQGRLIISDGHIQRIYNPEIIRTLPVRLWSCLLDKN